MSLVVGEGFTGSIKKDENYLFLLYSDVNGFSLDRPFYLQTFFVRSDVITLQPVVHSRPYRPSNLSSETCDNIKAPKEGPPKKTHVGPD